VDWWRVYLGYGLSLPLLALPLVLLQSPRTRFGLATVIVVFVAAATLETFGAAHYVAPAAGLLYFPVAQCFRRLALIGPVVRRIAAMWLTICVLTPSLNLLALRVWGPTLEPIAPRVPEWLANDLRQWLYHKLPTPFALERSTFDAERRQDGERHLVLVRYGPGHNFHEEFVYNDADIDGSPVVWAREMGPDGQARLLRYFKDRVVWILVDDEHGVQILGPYRVRAPGGSGR
jgi:hypothetical protein